MKEKIVAIVPAYNEEKTIGHILKELNKYADEIVVVDDASTDKTFEEAKKQTAFVLEHDINQGYDKTIDDGFKEAAKRKPTIFFTFDADGQHIPSDIPRVIAPIQNKKTDVVVGIRPYKQRFSEKMFSRYSNKKIGITDPLCGIKAYSIKTYNSIGYFDKIQSIGTELLFNCHKHGFVIKEVKIGINKRDDYSRFGNFFKSNFKIVSALFKIYLKFK